MKPRITVLTLGVDDWKDHWNFIKTVYTSQLKGSLGQEFENGAVAFFDLQNGVKLAIWERKSLAKEANVPLSPRSPSEFTIGHNVRQ